MTHTKSAERYVSDVIGGAVPACKWVRAACQRQLDDLARQPDEEWPYYFDEGAAERVCAFVELMPHVKGEWAARRETITLEPSQAFILTTVFGWLHKETGLRRYRQVYEEVARKNAKSAKVSGVANYMFQADGEVGAEVWSAATTRDQASIIAKVSRSMMRKAARVRTAYGVKLGAHAMSIPETDCTYQALASESHTLDGLSPHFCAVDELHAHRNRDVYDVLNSALGARSQPILWCVTTAGFDQSGICYEVREYAAAILNDVLHRHDGMGYPVKGNTATDETFFPIIYTIDEGDDFADPEVWAKANPLLGVSVKLDDMERMCRRAQQQPSELGNFLTKRLNVWCSAADAFFNMVDWKNCADYELDEADFEGDGCKLAGDLSSKRDFTCLCRSYRRELDGEEHYFLFWTFYLPEDRVEDSPNAQYQGWARQDLIRTTSGAVVDYDEIETDILDFSARTETEIGLDPWHATQLRSHLEDEGLEPVEIRATVQNFSEPMKWLDALIAENRIHHNGDPIASWMIANVEAQRDRKGNVFPRKAGEKQANKIDGAVTAIMTCRLWLDHDGTQALYETEGIG